jgi:hypothetical protein
MEKRSDSIIKDSIEYGDRVQDKSRFIYDEIKYVRYNEDKNLIYLFNEKLKHIYTYHYETISCYRPTMGLWVWWWSTPKSLEKTKISRKVLEYGLTLDENEAEVKTLIINSRFQITHPTQLDILLGLASYLGKINIFMFFPVLLDGNNKHMFNGKEYFDITAMNNKNSGDIVFFYQSLTPIK